MAASVDITGAKIGTAIQVPDLAITELQTITAFGLGDNAGDYLFTLDELQDVTLSQAEESTEITGRGGRRLATLKQNKTVTISGTSGLYSAGLLELQTGGNFAKSTTATVKRTEYLPVVSNTVTLNYTPSGAIDAVYVRDDSGIVSKVLTVTSASSVSAGNYKINAGSSSTPTTLTLAEADAASSVIVVYNSTVTGNVLTNDSGTFAQKAALYIDALAEDKCANTYRVQIYIPKADFSGEFDIALGGDQTVQAFSAEALAGSFCGADATAGTLWTWTVFTDAA